MDKNTIIPLSLYIHFPWCIKKCPYCDFNSYALKDTIAEKQYINTLINDLALTLPYVENKKLISIFIGGGTPSIFSAQAICDLLANIKKQLEFAPNIEITIEANPGTVDQEKLNIYKQAGINRVSLGVQSFDDDKLKSLGRIHSSKQAIKAVELTKKAGFKNINLDIMHDLPNQSLLEACQDLQTAIELEPSHISWYQLTLEPKTPFYHNPPALPDEQTCWDIQEKGLELLNKHRYNQYEVSAFSSSSQCIHNKNYWQFGDYIGIGAGSHSKLTNIKENKIIRIEKKKHPKNYLANPKQYISLTKTLNDKDLVSEFMLNALRLTNGFSLPLFTQRTRLPIKYLEKKLEIAENKGLLKIKQNIIVPTQLGQRFLNNLTELFLYGSD